MNLKKAKALRRFAKRALEGSSLPYRIHLQHVRTGQIINSPESYRGFYRALKKGGLDVNSAGAQRAAG